jgi:hypothetical protein
MDRLPGEMEKEEKEFLPPQAILIERILRQEGQNGNQHRAQMVKSRGEKEETYRSERPAQDRRVRPGRWEVEQ